jgi:molybdopterin-binding protein
MNSNAAPNIASTSSETISDAIGTFPAYINQAASSVSFDSAHPDVITVTGWTLDAAGTMAKYGASFWMFDPVNGQITYGRWAIYTAGTLVFNCIESYPKWTVTTSGAEANGIPDRTVRQFDQCVVQNIGSGDVVVSGITINSGKYMNFSRGGNALFPLIINATNGAIAQVSTGQL